jgi:adenine-specific DNA-methyltransferase
MLIRRILELSTKPGDLVLDSFLGSGTTAAVAHKLHRRWIGIEMAEHCYTHCKPRLDKIIDGTDQTGISKNIHWQGGGGYHFYELADSLLVKNDKLPVYQINPSYTFEMLCEAICKIEGFKYKPEDVFHGHSSEKRFIHITKEFVNAGYVKSLSARLADGQSLLIYGMKIQSDMILPDNIEVKKIPKGLLDKCNFESEAE